MLRRFHFFDQNTGLIHAKHIALDVPSGHDAIAGKNAPAGHAVLEGTFDPLSQKVDTATGGVVDYQPPQPSAEHEWNADTKRWALNVAAQAKLDARHSALAQIGALEGGQHRKVREAVLAIADASHPAVAPLQALDAQIAALRKDLQ